MYSDQFLKTQAEMFKLLSNALCKGRIVRFRPGKYAARPAAARAVHHDTSAVQLIAKSAESSVSKSAVGVTFDIGEDT